ncbi:MAG: glycosyltransferase family 39 protein [Gammaproteobacteria bacterium]|nr:glycosyltransferase family 39 protein [Gammaproteobacteria bacterium]
MQIPQYSDFKTNTSDKLLYSTKQQDTVNGVRLCIALITAINLLLIVLLFTFREFDDNRLTSWQWLMDGQQVLVLSLILTGVLMISWHTHLHRIRLNAPLSLLIMSMLSGLVLWSEPEVIVDSARYFSQAKYLSEYGFIYFVQQWGYGISSWTDLPLIPFIYGTAFKLFGESRLVIQCLTLLMMTGTVLLTYLIGKELWDSATGFYGAALLLGMPLLLSQVPLMLVDIPSMFFLTLSIWTCLHVMRMGSGYWIILAAFSVAMAMLSKYSVWLMLTVIPVLLLTCHQFNWKRDAKHLLWVVYGAALLLAPFVVMKIDLILDQIRLLASYQLPALGRWQESPVSTFFFQIHPLISLAALASIYHAIQQRDWHYLPIIWMWLLIFAIGVNRSRYILIALPMLALMAAYTLRWIQNQEVRHYLLLSIIVTSLVLTVGAYRPFIQSTSASNLQAAGKYLDQLNVDAVEVIVLPQQLSIINPEISIPILDLYTQKTLLYQRDTVKPSGKQDPAIKNASLRFTWEVPLPDFYNNDDRITRRAIAVISSHPQQALPTDLEIHLKDYQATAQFSRTEAVFRYRTDVTVYEPYPALLKGRDNLPPRGSHDGQ